METRVINSTDDPGFFVLEILLRLLGVGNDPEQLRQAVGYRPLGVGEMVSYARKNGLAARCLKSNWERLSSHPLPGIAVLRNGSFLVLGKVETIFGVARAGLELIEPRERIYRRQA